MAIFTFSTKTRKPEDERLVLDVKANCDKHNVNFSGLLIKLLREHNDR